MKISNYQRQTTGKTNLIKYLNPSSLIQPKTYKNRSDVSNIHCRSMQELDFNANGVSLSKQNLKTNIHHSSLFSDKDSIKGQQQPGKSKSLSKFITFFQNSNLLNQNQLKKQNKDVKRSNYNGFSYDLKISGNSTCGNNKKILRKKQKQNINYQTINSQRQLNTINSNKSNLIVKNNENISPNKNNQTQDILLSRMKQVIQEQKRRQIKYCQRINELQRNNKQLMNERNKDANELSLLLQKIDQYENKINSYENKINNYESKTNNYENKINSYENKIKQLQKKVYQLGQRNKQISNKQHKHLGKQSRQQDMIIKSLKKVINQQMNKIIQLQRVKIQNEYLRQKLSNQQNQSILDNNQYDKQYSFQYQVDNKKKISPSSSSRQQNLSYSRQQTLNNSRKQTLNNSRKQTLNNSRKQKQTLNNSRKQNYSNQRKQNCTNQRKQNCTNQIRQKQKYFDYGKQQFKKSKFKYQLTNDNQNQSNNKNHYKSIFQIQQSPISVDQNISIFFKASQIKTNNNNRMCRQIKKDDKKQVTNMIKIIQGQSQFSRQAIQQVNEQNEQIQNKQQRLNKNNKNNNKNINKNTNKNINYNNNNKQQLRQVEQDSILQQVDQYLTKWRNKS